MRRSRSTRAPPSTSQAGLPSSGGAGASSGTSCPSCSSRTSPTISSTMSSSVTTRRRCRRTRRRRPRWAARSLRSRVSSGRTGRVSGTSSAGRAIRATGVRSRSCAGTARASLRWTMPAISSIRSRYTGKRDRPVARVRLTTSSAVAEAWRALTRTRGVMTCCAVSSPRDRVRTKRSAVSCSRAPARAEWRASETSSPGVRGRRRAPRRARRPGPARAGWPRRSVRR